MTFATPMHDVTFYPTPLTPPTPENIKSPADTRLWGGAAGDGLYSLYVADYMDGSPVFVEVLL